MQYQSECLSALKSIANIHKPFEKTFMDTMKLFMAIPDCIDFLQLGRYGCFSEQTYRNLVEHDSPQLVWRFVETVNGKYNGVYYVVWNYFIGKSSDIVGAYINSKGDEYEVNLKCTSHESLRESDGY